ncbi:MBL fold metallo-hydrolase [Paenibacillus sp. GSMTC-2017]|uniref:MBL fold metallo-hydrolase n=1 Tax=Paenibacillus sp. GSMTC-2017 TaxID=2794350 RepID=UPI0018D9A2B0|nr:MBL fold metallo-hydrolase [Paenibacillus sp. GSMTC-2017]MBH5320940.1 MBL fold metallo-hydrolase [Paenibacillus sp. GSMTC-2017]
MIHYQNEHVTVFQSELFQTTSTVIQTNDILLIVDPNWLSGEVEAIKQYVNAIKAERDTYLLFTHGDFDHIIGYRAFPDAKVIGSSGLHHHSEKEQKLEMIREFDAKNYIHRNYPIEFPRLDIVIHEDGQQLRVGDTSITFYLAPGHTADGLITVVEPFGIMIAGDYLSNFELPFIYDSARAYIQTLEKTEGIFADHSINLLIPGHGQATDDSLEMNRRLDMATDYLNRLIEAVRSNGDAVLEALYTEHAFLSPFTEYCHKENIRIIRSEFL